MHPLCWLPAVQDMITTCQSRSLMSWVVLLSVCLVAAGCRGLDHASEAMQPSGDSPIPRELTKVTLPEYVVEPPDILLIDAVRVVPKPPYRIEPLDVLYIS